MDFDRQRRVQLIVIVVVLVGPLVLAIWRPEWGTVLFLLGLFIALRAMRVMRADALRELRDDRGYQRMQQHQGERGHTIWVSLLDEGGQPLSEAAAERKLAEARAQAGPRDMVVGVKRKL